jgi:transketolase
VRIGLQDVFATGAKSGPYLFERYGLGTGDVVAAAWRALGRPDPVPEVAAVPVSGESYAPV